MPLSGGVFTVAECGIIDTLLGTTVRDVAGDTEQALSLLREVAEGLAADGTDEEKGVLQLLLGDATYQVGALMHCCQHQYCRTV